MSEITKTVNPVTSAQAQAERERAAHPGRDTAHCPDCRQTVPLVIHECPYAKKVCTTFREGQFGDHCVTCGVNYPLHPQTDWRTISQAKTAVRDAQDNPPPLNRAQRRGGEAMTDCIHNGVRYEICPWGPEPEPIKPGDLKAPVRPSSLKGGALKRRKPDAASGCSCDGGIVPCGAHCHG